MSAYWIEQSDTVSVFSTLFRNGIAEADEKLNVGGKDGLRNIYLTGVEQGLACGIGRCWGDTNGRRSPRRIRLSWTSLASVELHGFFVLSLNILTVFIY